MARSNQDILRRRAYGDEEGDVSVAQGSPGNYYGGNHHRVPVCVLFLAGRFGDQQQPGTDAALFLAPLGSERKKRLNAGYG